jgi:hypothetical protein
MTPDNRRNNPSFQNFPRSKKPIKIMENRTVHLKRVYHKDPINALRTSKVKLLKKNENY